MLDHLFLLLMAANAQSTPDCLVKFHRNDGRFTESRLPGFTCQAFFYPLFVASTLKTFIFNTHYATLHFKRFLEVVLARADRSRFSSRCRGAARR